jgi:aminoglycoside phosphotransferase (APT) family kinase protein
VGGVRANTEPAGTATSLPLDGLLPYLAAHLDGFDPARPVDVELMPGGRSNVTYRLGQGQPGRGWVLRRPPYGHVMPTAHDMSREYTIIAGLHGVGFPVPAPLALCEDTAVIGAPFALMGFVDGRVVADATDAAALSPAEADAICENLLATLVTLHATAVGPTGLSGYGRPGSFFARQVRRWGQQWERSRSREVDGVADLTGWLAGRDVPAPAEATVVHGDYRLDNVILDGTAVRAVLDWEMATVGDPLTDLALALVYWTEPGDRLRREVPVARDTTSGPGFWSRARLADAYLERTGRSGDHLAEYLALASWKLAVILESIYYRTVQGQQRGVGAGEAAALAGAVPALVRLGLAARDHGLAGLST